MTAILPAEPGSPDSPPPRLSNRALPPYRYIPGINAHPVRDPAGHSYGREHVPLQFSPPEAWRQNQEYLFGIDLYNAAFWWESHEAWEEVWHTTDKDAPHGQFLQGLIQVSAAFIKWHLMQREGLVKLFRLGQSRLEFTAKTCPHFMGVDLIRHLSALNHHFAPVLAEIKDWPDALKDYPFLILH